MAQMIRNDSKSESSYPSAGESNSHAVGSRETAGSNRSSLNEPDAISQLLPWLNWVDERIRCALMAGQAVYGMESAHDSYRGLYITPRDVDRLLGQRPGQPLFGHNGSQTFPEQLPLPSRFSRLAKACRLSSFDIAVVFIALAPEFDLRYEKLYAYLQDDVSRRRPTVDLALNLLCVTVQDKLTRREHFSSTAPLLRHNLLRLIPDPNQPQPPLLSHYLKVDEQIIDCLLGQECLDPRLAPYCRILTERAFRAGSQADMPEEAAHQQALLEMIRRSLDVQRPVKLYFHGPDGAWTLRIVEGLVGCMGASLLVLDVTRALESGADFEQLFKLALRDAMLREAILCIDGVDALRAPDRILQYQRFMEVLAQAEGLTMLTGGEAWMSSGSGLAGVIAVPVGIPGFAQRRAYWSHNLEIAGIPLDASDLDALASRFRLMPDQISDAVVTASNAARWRTAVRSEDAQPSSHRSHATVAEVFAAACAQSGQDLAKLVRKVNVKYTLGDIVLPPDQLTQLKEISEQARHRHIVFGEWGFDRKLSVGKGLNVMFSGPPGTGKTMAAEIIAKELHLPLYKIDLSRVVSKYIGETEKHLDRIFAAAQRTDAILFFDEADALFGKRTEVRDSHDRYANIEVGYLLQKMEEYEGVAVLATNVRQHMDEAFVRRMQMIVEFPFPDEMHRRHIWEIMFPREAPLADDVDLSLLAREVRLAGGNIKNIALAAAFYAAGDGGMIRMSHLIRAARREHQKVGRMWNDAVWSEPGVASQHDS
ncbi:MAG: ATPase, AAA family [Nitrospira sp.]|jgi:hypothetical protein|nr:MAG: ATPase, AAA family [Nitrospira sp.]